MDSSVRLVKSHEVLEAIKADTIKPSIIEVIPDRARRSNYSSCLSSTKFTNDETAEQIQIIEATKDLHGEPHGKHIGYA